VVQGSSVAREVHLMPIARHRLFTTHQVCTLADVPAWFVTDLCRRGAVVPVCPGARGAGSTRLFSFGQLLAVAFAGELRGAGLTGDWQRRACRWACTANPGEIRLPAAIAGVVKLEQIEARVIERAVQMVA
jgi:hypothetical protein